MVAGVYLALMGPENMRELGMTILQRSHYAAKLLSEIKGVVIPFSQYFFKEFVVEFRSKKSVKSVNKALLQNGIFGGKDLSSDFGELGNAALYSITEIHTKEDIDRLATTMRRVLA
jgi:glycine dehydrogenase subunit 1